MSTHSVSQNHTLKYIIYGFLSFHMGRKKHEIDRLCGWTIILIQIPTCFPWSHIIRSESIANSEVSIEVDSPYGQDVYKHILQRNFLIFFLQNHQLLLFECYKNAKETLKTSHSTWLRLFLCLRSKSIQQNFWLIFWWFLFWFCTFFHFTFKMSFSLFIVCFLSWPNCESI